ncbi:hypothetical protein CKO_05062 [Citrobacter koseri ATCC BAA-895]|uniref:Uncharacterized protein n=1 Tax=Citrobacter koseri (strain ATCC BAA-895 / CDC 4225-83 / SGSC4696) TaxID=290338 RepID=A8ARJ2_CITK8|nr:hypothetical protein CKO_05062 [Citrobacter koseri ATCC BAA-895]
MMRRRLDKTSAAIRQCNVHRGCLMALRLSGLQGEGERIFCYSAPRT